MSDKDYKERLAAYEPNALIHEYGIPGALAVMSKRLHELEDLGEVPIYSGPFREDNTLEELLQEDIDRMDREADHE